MAYNSYYPQAYYQPSYPMPYNTQNPPQNASAGNNSGIIWVQGEAAAKAFPVASGQSVLLMDSEDSVMYIKSTDQSGMPQPLRIFEYTEKSGKHTEPSATRNQPEEYVSRTEFEQFREDINRTIRSFNKEEGEG